MRGFGIALSCVYALGIVAVQIHLLRFGILDITAIDIYYFLVGSWVLMSLLPCGVLLLVTEFVLFGKSSAYTKLISIGLTVGLLCFSAWIVQYRAHQYVLNFNTYPYPKWYVYWNFTAVNLVLLLIWLILLRARKLGCSPLTARAVGLGLSSLAVLIFSVFFGRTIYPALDKGVGGGASQFAWLWLSIGDGVRKPVMLVHVSDSYVYFMELTAFPQDIESREPSEQYAKDCSGPVYRALARNSVTRISHDKVDGIDMIGFNQKKIIDRYLFEGRYFFWQRE